MVRRPSLWVAAALVLVACGGGGGGFSSSPSDGGGDGAGPGSGSSADDSQDAGPASTIDVPVVVQEAIPKGRSGTDRFAGVATFGLPFPRAQDLGLDPDTGRPALAVEGAGSYQFRTLGTWPSGEVRWALVDLKTDLVANGTASLRVVEGTGSSGQRDVGSDLGSAILLDTGPLQLEIATDAFNLFRTVVVDGVTVLDGTEPGLVGTTLDGQPLVPAADTTVELVENGPVRAAVAARGTLVDPSDTGLIDFTCRIEASAGHRDATVTLTLRNASEDRPQHAVLGSVELVAPLSLGGPPVVTISADGEAASTPLAPGESAWIYQGQTNALVSGLGSSTYRPHIPTNGDDSGDQVDKGYELVLGADTVQGLGSPNDYPYHGWLDAQGTDAGVTVSIQGWPFLYPLALEADADGRVTAGVFTDRNPGDYTLVWQQHESRSAVFSFRAGTAAGDPEHVARVLDFPLLGRAADYAYYDETKVFPYRLCTPESQADAYQQMFGASYTPSPPNPDLLVTRYLYKGTTGGSNNFPRIESWLHEWLRHGNGGSFLSGRDLALYKSEWQIRRSDDFDYEQAWQAAGNDDPVATNDEIPHTTLQFSDDEHRYREGIVLAYFLTGDERFRDALFDEAEVLRTVSVWPHERSMYRTLVAMARVIEFTGDLELRDDYLVPRLEYITEGIGSGGEIGIVDVDVDTEGAGWEGPPLAAGEIDAETDRRFYVWSGDNNSEKNDSPQEYFQTRGFITASFGPTAYYHAARVLPASEPMKASARARMRDLTFWTWKELYPETLDPAARRLVYSYGVRYQSYDVWENVDFHPILVGMAESWRDLVDVDTDLAAALLQRGVEQLEAAWVHGDLDNFDTRPDVQHFVTLWLEAQESPVP